MQGITFINNAVAWTLTSSRFQTRMSFDLFYLSNCWNRETIMRNRIIPLIFFTTFNYHLTRYVQFCFYPTHCKYQATVKFWRFNLHNFLLSLTAIVCTKHLPREQVLIISMLWSECKQRNDVMGIAIDWLFRSMFFFHINWNSGTYKFLNDIELRLKITCTACQLICVRCVHCLKM